MARDSVYTVDGFYYEDEDLYKEAKKEAEGVRYMKSRIDLQYPERVLSVYKRMIEQDTFQTQVGYAYLRELQDYLYTMPQIRNEQIPAIPVRREVRVLDAAGTAQRLRKEKKQNSRAFHWSFAVNVLALAVIIVMFAIAMSSDSPTVLDYENKLIDKYSAWEEELTEREAAVKEKERTLLDGDSY
jgi:hypothetical protein